jgi:hypothetical protein
MARMTRTRAAAIAAGAALASAAVIPSLGGAQAPPGTELTLKMKVVGAAQVKHNRKPGATRWPAATCCSSA